MLGVVLALGIPAQRFIFLRVSPVSPHRGLFSPAVHLPEGVPGLTPATGPVSLAGSFPFLLSVVQALGIVASNSSLAASFRAAESSQFLRQSAAVLRSSAGHPGLAALVRP